MNQPIEELRWHYFEIVVFSEFNQLKNWDNIILNFEPIEELRWYYFEIVAGTRRSWGWRQVWWKMTNLGEGCFSRFSFNFKFGLIFFYSKIANLGEGCFSRFWFPKTNRSFESLPLKLLFRVIITNLITNNEHVQSDLEDLDKSSLPRTFL